MSDIKIEIGGTKFEVPAGAKARDVLKLAGVPAKGPGRPLAGRFGEWLVARLFPLGHAGWLAPGGQSDQVDLTL